MPSPIKGNKTLIPHCLSILLYIFMFFIKTVFYFKIYNTSFVSFIFVIVNIVQPRGFIYYGSARSFYEPPVHNYQVSCWRSTLAGNVWRRLQSRGRRGLGLHGGRAGQGWKAVPWMLIATFICSTSICCAFAHFCILVIRRFHNTYPGKQFIVLWRSPRL